MNCKNVLGKSARLAATCGLGLTLAFGGVAAASLVDVPVASAEEVASYTVYQVMAGKISGDTIKTSKITGGTVNAANKQAIIDAVNAVKGAGTLKDGNNFDDDFQKVLGGMNDVEVQAFANQLAGNKNLTAATGVTAVANGDKLNVTLGQGGEQGYYLVVGKATASQAATSAILVPVGENGAQTDLKIKAPTITKTVDNGKKEADMGVVKDAVAAPTYKLVGTLPGNFNEYGTYYYQFTDKLPAGLDLEKTEDWKVGIKAVKSGVQDIDLSKAFTQDVTTENNTSTITWTANDLKQVEGLDSGYQIVVEYTPQLNNRDIQRLYQNGTSEFVNTATVTFSASPYSGATDTATTTDSTATAYSYNVVVKSVKAGDAILPGATFKLTSGEDPVGYTVTAGEGEVLHLTGLKAGVEYTLTEMDIPTGYKRVEPVKFTIDASDREAIEYKESSDPSGAANDTVNGATITIKVLSVEGINLPLTGQAGIVAGVVAGGLLITVSAVAIARNRRESE